MAATEIGHWYKRPISQKSCNGVMRMLQNGKKGKYYFTNKNMVLYARKECIYG